MKDEEEDSAIDCGGEFADLFGVKVDESEDEIEDQLPARRSTSKLQPLVMQRGKPATQIEQPKPVNKKRRRSKISEKFNELYPCECTGCEWATIGCGAVVVAGASYLLKQKFDKKNN